MHGIVLIGGIPHVATYLVSGHTTYKVATAEDFDQAMELLRSTRNEMTGRNLYEGDVVFISIPAHLRFMYDSKTKQCSGKRGVIFLDDASVGKKDIFRVKVYFPGHRHPIYVDIDREHLSKRVSAKY